MPTLTTDPQILEAALIGYQAEADRITAAIRDIEEELRERRGGTGTSASSAPGRTPRSKRNLSAAARRRIAAAQKKRWAAFHAAQGFQATTKATARTAPKRTLSPAAKAKLAANLKKARAAKAAKKSGESVVSS